MQKRYVLTMTAANRVGILAAVTNAIGDVGGDLVEIRQTVLQGFFTMIIAADFPEDRGSALVLQHVESACDRFGVLVTLKDPEEETVPPLPVDGTEAWQLRLEGTDKPGTMRTLARYLAGSRIDITNMHAARCEDAGGFLCTLDVAVPPTVDFEALQSEFESLCEGLGLVATAVRDDVLAGRSRSPEPAGKPR